MSNSKKYEVKSSPMPLRYAEGPFQAKDATVKIWSDGRWIEVPRITEVKPK